MSQPVLVIGATLMDIKGIPLAGLEPGTSNPSQISYARGGTARNVAENLARLGADVMLMSAVGNDYTGRLLVAQTADAGVNTSEVQFVDGAETGSYIAILGADGMLSVALDDVRVLEENITSGYLYQRRRLFRDASMVMVDGSLTDDALKMVVRLASQYKVPLVADPSSARLASKLCPYLNQLHLVVPNEAEAVVIVGEEFAGHDQDAALELADRLVKMGVRHAVVTMSDFGLAYATDDETGFIPARYREMVDSTGTGDALSAAVMFGMLEGLPAIEAMRLGAAAASLTLQTTETVVNDLSLDMLYDHLIV